MSEPESQAAREKRRHAAQLGFWIFLGSEVMFFAALFGLYASQRTAFPVAFKLAARRQELWLGTMNTLVLITSSLTVACAVQAVRAGRDRTASRLLITSLGLGCVFLAIKATEYASHIREGIVPGPGFDATLESGAIATTDGVPPPLERGFHVFYNLYYAMTGLHAIHVMAGIAVLAWLAATCRKRHGASDPELAVELGGLYWHLVDLIWLFLWPIFYLLR